MEAEVRRLRCIYQGMKARCYNPNSIGYATYGGKGIDICEEWLNSVDSFIEWSLNNGYESELTIDRIDGSKGYSPDNCRWVDWKTQANNKRHYWLPQDFLDAPYEKMPDEEQFALRKEIKRKLCEYELTQVWLIQQLRRANIITDKTEMSSILSGTRGGAKAETLLRMSRSILRAYERYEDSIKEGLRDEWTKPYKKD